MMMLVQTAIHTPDRLAVPTVSPMCAQGEKSLGYAVEFGRATATKGAARAAKSDMSRFLPAKTIKPGRTT